MDASITGRWLLTGPSGSDAMLATAHSVSLTGLSAGETTHYAITAIYGSGTPASGWRSRWPFATFGPGRRAASVRMISVGRRRDAGWPTVDPVGDGSASLSGQGTGGTRGWCRRCRRGRNHNVWTSSKASLLVQQVGGTRTSGWRSVHSVLSRRNQTQARDRSAPAEPAVAFRRWISHGL